MDPVTVTKDDPVTIIRINRPQVRNAINGETAVALREAWLAFDVDESARVGVLTGGDEVFCAGADLKEFASLLDGVGEDGPGPLGYTRLFISKPTIAAVAGYAVAGDWNWPAGVICALRTKAPFLAALNVVSVSP